jgi:hypothetical protein
MTIIGIISILPPIQDAQPEGRMLVILGDFPGILTIIMIIDVTAFISFA